MPAREVSRRPPRRSATPAADRPLARARADGNIRYYEYEADNLHFLSEFGAKDPQRGMTFLPRRALDVSENEVARAFKISGSTVEPLAFIVPRKAENFQACVAPSRVLRACGRS